MPKKSTTEDFVRRAQALHGHRYDYSKTRYIAALVKVTIICPKHGEFQQTPAHHLFGKGQRCPACGGAKKKNTEQFIVDACKIHGDKYDYSKVRYKNAKTKVTIICREHGPFEQKPNGHLMGDGCPACGIVRTQEHHAALRTGMSAEERTRSKGRRTAEEFIADAHRLYGDKYDYGQVKYVNSYTKATIICRKLGHGAWQQTPKDHLHGYGCPQCYADRRGDTTRGTAEGFIARAQAKHGDKYDYGRVEYRNSDTKVTIICREHGEFEQSPYSHLQGQGCPICGDKRSADAGRWTKEQFLRRAKEVHGHKYDYSQVEYKSALTKVTIICPRHGPWEQTPANHLFGLGTGCPACSESEGARTVRLVLESLGSRFKSEYRIPECRDKRALPFDFAVWVAGILHLIEFHGRQHYERGGIWIRRKGHTITDKEFKEIQKRDAVKSNFCANHSIPLLVIPYWEMKNVEILAREFLTALPC